MSNEFEFCNMDERTNEEKMEVYVAKLEQQLAQHQWIPVKNEDEAYIIVYEDNFVEADLFAGHGAKEAAIKTFNERLKNWNCHLFVKITTPSEVSDE